MIIFNVRIIEVFLTLHAQRFKGGIGAIKLALLAPTLKLIFIFCFLTLTLNGFYLSQILLHLLTLLFVHLEVETTVVQALCEVLLADLLPQVNLLRFIVQGTEVI